MRTTRVTDQLIVFQAFLICFLFAGLPAVAGGGTTPREILRMHRNGLSTDVLLEHLEVTGVDGRLTEQKARTMRKAGVARSVLRNIRILDDTDTNDPVAERQQQGGDTEHAHGRREAKGHPTSSEPGTLLLRSHSEQPVWFRRDPDGRTLYLSGTERSSMPSLSGGEGMKLAIEPGVWTVKIPNMRAGHQLRFAPGRTGRITIVGRNRQAVKVSWQPDHPNGNERQLSLERNQLGMEQVQEVLQSQREDRSRRTRPSSRRDQYQNRSRTGFRLHSGSSAIQWGGRSPILQYGHPSVQFHHSLLPGYSFHYRDRHHRRSYHRNHRSQGFDFHLDLNHDFEADGLRGALRYRSGRSGFHDHFFHFD